MTNAESILRQLTGPVLILDTNLCAILANPAFIKALRIIPELLEGKPVRELVQGEPGKPGLQEILLFALDHGEPVANTEITCIVPPGERRVMLVNANLHEAVGGWGQFVLVELRDLTHEKATEQKVEELNEALQLHATHLEGMNRELESFTYSVSHDLRTPLRLTNKIAHLLLTDLESGFPAAAAEKVHMILDGTRDMGKLIEDLLLFSHVNFGPVEKKRVNMRRLAREALAELNEETAGRKVEVSIDELPGCMGERALLKQVFLNLMGNALKFSRPQEIATVHVGFRQTPAETIYFVRDNGVGFDMRYAESMFLAFHRLHRASNFEGSGVGLALVKRIIDRHDGRIWAEGQTNQGATFSFIMGE